MFDMDKRTIFAGNEAGISLLKTKREDILRKGDSKDPSSKYINDKNQEHDFIKVLLEVGNKVARLKRLILDQSCAT